MGLMQGKSSNEVVSQLGEGVELSGDFYFSKGVHIGGVVKGKIKADTSLEVGPTGRIEAEVEVRRISIRGEFHGTIRASERVEIHKEGKVRGEIFSPCLIIESGAFFDGHCNMGDNTTSASSAASSAPPSGNKHVHGKKDSPKNDILKLN
jgi:cytoskeletal protein CcmA (bactofilin family)